MPITSPSEDGQWITVTMAFRQKQTRQTSSSKTVSSTEDLELHLEALVR
jgi:hypothetical protein